MDNLFKAIKKVQSVGTRFASILYRNKEGELSRYTILLGASYEVAKQKDLAKLLILAPRLQGVEKVACDEMIDSMRKPVGTNEAYTNKDTYEETGIKGLKKHKENGSFHLMGYQIKKEVLEPITYAKVNSSDKTLAKARLKKLAKFRTIKQFKLEASHVGSLTIDGKTLMIKAD